MKTIRLSEYGVLPNTDITSDLISLFEKNKEDTAFIFENADYYFSPKNAKKVDYRISNSDVTPYRTLAIYMKDMKNCILVGNGARLWLSGQMQVFTLDRCENVTLQGFEINWKKPLAAEGRVVAKNGEEMDVFIDPQRFPHRFVGGNLEFDTGADEWYPFTKCAIVFEPNTLRARRDISDFGIKSITPLGNSTYRFGLWCDENIYINDILNLRHSPRIHAGIFTEKCSDITVENIIFYSCGGLGCLSQFCRNMTYRGVHFMTDKKAGRLVSGGRDDGMHITCNSGTVSITECTFHALMDDPINVHGCCVTSDEAVDEKTLRCRYRHHQACGFLYWAEEGDEISFISRSSMESVGKGRVCSYTLEDRMTFLLTFDSPIPKEIAEMAKKGDLLALDNLTNTPSFICKNNRFGSCRARGVLVSTPQRVVISNNYFESSGSAILVAGDSNYWFESGECHDVEISNNVFTDSCLSSIYQFCDGVISISPVVPSPKEDKPYHKNIRITDNVFDTVGIPLLYALSCENLIFSKNRIFKSPSIPYEYPKKPLVRLYYCNDVTIEDNQYIGSFESVEYTYDHCMRVKRETN